VLDCRVNCLFPHYVDAQQAGMRGLNVGCYAIDQEGDIASALSRPQRMREEHRPVAERNKRASPLAPTQLRCGHAERRDEQIVETEARAAVTGHNVRYVLAFSIGGVVVVFAIIYFLFFG
jgi:hypothetical protein